MKINQNRYVTTFPHHVLEDEVKWVILPPKIILSSLSVWPEGQNKISALLSFLCFTSLIFFLLGELAYVKKNISNSAEVVAGAASVIVVVQVLIKQILLIYFREKISRILSTIYFEFWPSNIVGKECEKKLSFKSWYLAIYCSASTLSAVFCGLEYLVTPLITGNGNLPFLSYYSFVESDGILYVVFYVWQSFMCEVVPYMIWGFDFLFASLLWNCIAQFKILGHFFRTNFKETVLEKSFSRSCANKTKYKILLIKSVSHHYKVIQTCKELEDIFSFYLVMVSLTSVVALCVTSFFLISLPTEFGKMITYLLAFLGELFICCFLGSELMFESTQISNAIFESGWYLPEVSMDLKKSLMMVMVKSQKEVRLTIGGFSTLSLTTFFQVLKLSFSCYTLLNYLLQRRR